MVNQDKHELNGKGNRRGMHPNSQNNIKGKHNPRGRPPLPACITSIQREMLPLPCPYDVGKSWAEWLAERGLALAGENARYYAELLDRLEGKVTLPVSGEVNQNVSFIIGKGYVGEKDGNRD